MKSHLLVPAVILCTALEKNKDHGETRYSQIDTATGSKVNNATLRHSEIGKYGRGHSPKEGAERHCGGAKKAGQIGGEEEEEQ